MTPRKTIVSALLTGLLGCVLAASGRAATLTSTPQPITLIAAQAESLTVTLSGASTVNFTLNGTSPALGSVIPTWTTAWNLNSTRTSVNVCVYLSGPLVGTDTPTNNIPGANVLGQPEAAGAFTALTGNGCGQVGNALLISTTATTPGNESGTKNDSVALEIAGLAMPMPADTYTGILNVVAQTVP
jgi:hypothetical protein